MKNSIKHLKKTFPFFTAFLLMASLTVAAPAEAKGDPEKTGKKTVTTTSTPSMTEIEERVEEIKQMDKAELTRAERRALKKELREMEEAIKMHNGQGLYISFGALLIIILLLILIL